MPSEHKLIYAGHDIAVDYLDAGSQLTLVTFEHRNRFIGALNPEKFGAGYGKGRFAPLGLNEVLVKTSRNHWYQTAEMNTAIEIINKVNSGKSIFTYGSSMGAFAAINFAPLLNASAFIAVSPLHSINPNGEIGETRWNENLLLEFTHDFIANGDCKNAKGYAFFTSGTLDEKHAKLIERDTAGSLFPLEYGGHPCSFYLNEAYGIKKLVKKITLAEFDQETFYNDLASGTLSTYYPYEKRAQAMSNEGRVEEAIEQLKIAINCKSSIPSLHNKIGDLYLDIGDLDLAEYHFKYSIQLAKRSWPFVRLSYVHAKRGRFYDSVAAMKSAISLSPNRPEYFIRLGEWLILAGDLKSAYNAMERAIEIKPNAVTAPKRLAEINRMMSSSSYGRPR